MRARHYGSRDDETEINLTPMLDVTFIMLIFFIVTTSFVKEWGITVSRPTQSQDQTPDKSENILIAITASGEVFMRRRSIDVRAVRPNVERERAENPRGAVIIIAEKGARTGVLVDVMDQVKLAGVEDVSVASQSAAALRGG